MAGAVEGLGGYLELMDLPMDEFIEVRNNVVSISNRRSAEMRSARSMRRG